LGGKDAPAGKEKAAAWLGMATAALARMRPLHVHLLSNEDSQTSVLSSRFASVKA